MVELVSYSHNAIPAASRNNVERKETNDVDYEGRFIPAKLG